MRNFIVRLGSVRDCKRRPENSYPHPRFRWKTLGLSFESLRVCPESIEGTNGGAIEIIVVFPFMLSLVEAFIGLFSRTTDALVAVVLNLITVGIGEIDRVLPSPAFDVDAIFFERLLDSLKSGGSDFEADMLQALIAGSFLRAFDKVQQIVAAWRRKKEHIGRMTERDFESQHVGVKRFSLFEVARFKGDVTQAFLSHE